MFTGTFDGQDYFRSTKEIEAYFSAIHARVGFNPFHSDMAGGGNQTVRHSAGMLLSRLYYWGTPNQLGQRRQRIYREGEYWTAMSQRDWWEDVRLSRSQVIKAKDVLSEPYEETKGPFKGFMRGPLIEVRRWKWARPGKRQGVVTHYRILWENYHAALREISIIFAGIIESVDQEAAVSDLHDSDNQKTRETDTRETRESMDTQKTRESLTLESSLDSKTLDSEPTTTMDASKNGKVDPELLSLLDDWGIWENRAKDYARRFERHELEAAHGMAFDKLRRPSNDNPPAHMCSILDRWLESPRDREREVAERSTDQSFWD